MTTTVGIADMKIVKIPDILVTYALGSCVGVCILDKVKGMAGMAHIMLPYNQNGDNSTVLKYADTGINEMVKQMELRGCMRVRMTAKIVGGAKMFDVSGDGILGNIGERNVEAVRRTLAELKIRIIAADTGLNYGRTIFFDSTNGDVTVKTFSKNNKVI